MRIDTSALEFYSRLNDFYFQFRGIANNYNQTVHAINRGFTERTAQGYLADLVRHTRELKALSEKILALAAQFNARYAR